MADLLIRGMEMPISCPCKLLGIGYDLYCSATAGNPERVKEYYECCETSTRPPWCPLVEVPDHDDLIDRAELLIDLMDRGIEGLQTDDYQEIQQAVADAKPIIPASKEGGK